MTDDHFNLDTMNINAGTKPSVNSYHKSLTGENDNSKTGSNPEEALLADSDAKSFTPFLKVISAFAAIGGFLFGYDTGVVSGALILLKQEFQLQTVWQELFVSVTIAAAAISASVGGLLNDRLGRRPVILISSVFFLAGSVILAASFNKVMLIIGRGVVGTGVGLASMTVPMYIAEASPSHIRGTMVTINNLFITGGQFVAALTDGVLSYWPWGWRCMLGLAAIPSLIQLVGFLFLPESPRWLIKNGRLEEGRHVLLKIYGRSRYMTAFEAIKMSAEQEREDSQKNGVSSNTLLRMLKTPTVRRALMLGCGLQMFQQLAGINTIMYYSASIIRMSGVKNDQVVIWLAAAVAFVNFSFTLVGVYFVEKLGRRMLALISMAGVAFSQVFLAVAFVFISKTSPEVKNWMNGTANLPCSSVDSCDSCILYEECGFCFDSYPNHSIANSYCLPEDQRYQNQSSDGPCSRLQLPANQYTWAPDYCPSPLSFLALVGLIMYLMFFAPGMGPLPWTINAEIFPQWARSSGNAITSTVNWTFNIFVSMTFLSLTEVITRQGTFGLYAVICFTGLLFIYLCLPETKGKRLEEVTDLFNSPFCRLGRASRERGQYEVLNQEDDGNT
ncbi:putative proton myo-inositol cotransporter [Apostichopus japonicus]|uniref:Putative proton myo-inositol cotransporter n=1 Tax=Stichopus japonicus TaxID=307972 RepID=A0A2G8JL46_STIJA|nr:putative proton myo-inositol cotransporter [Apostichopus japonicus]